MKTIVLFITLISSVSYAAPKIKILPSPYRIGVSWDLQYEQGFMTNNDVKLSRRFFGRVKAGLLLGYEPWLLSMGPVVEGAGLPDLAWGFQIEITHMWNGLWGQGTISVDGQGHGFSALSVGWSLFGFEWQHRISSGGLRNGYLIKIRIPIGIYFFAR